MGLIKGNFSFMQFSVEGRLPQAFNTFIHDRIKGNAFREAQNAAEEKGWAGSLRRMSWIPTLKTPITRWAII